MDWLEDKYYRLKERLRQSSLKNALILYIVFAIISVIVVYTFTIRICDNWDYLISINKDTRTYVVYNEKNGEYIHKSNQSTTRLDRNIHRVIELIRNYSILIYSGFAIYYTSRRFYKDKILEPIEILMKEAKCISRNDFSFSCNYQSKDELGAICQAFDYTRRRLIKNQDTIEGLMEAQSQLNAAFAHDLRTPLTVMKGYTELLLRYYPEGKISQEKLLETIQLVHAQINRLQQFSETMKGIRNFEALVVEKKEMKAIEIIDLIQANIQGLNVRSKIQFTVEGRELEEIIAVDTHLVLEVLDNPDYQDNQKWSIFPYIQADGTKTVIWYASRYPHR